MDIGSDRHVLIFPGFFGGGYERLRLNRLMKDSTIACSTIACRVGRTELVSNCVSGKDVCPPNTPIINTCIHWRWALIYYLPHPVDLVMPTLRCICFLYDRQTRPRQIIVPIDKAIACRVGRTELVSNCVSGKDVCQPNTLIINTCIHWRWALIYYLPHPVDLVMPTLLGKRSKRIFCIEPCQSRIYD
ncbi:hypothetical protein IQ255_27175 [Pleurocapsales cyanobacterium LEGE 10410]|nr:hypothetical protein [Pleurocapsales cyanobacterium LEGE 10410]